MQLSILFILWNEHSNFRSIDLFYCHTNLKFCQIQISNQWFNFKFLKWPSEGYSKLNNDKQIKTILARKLYILKMIMSCRLKIAFSNVMNDFIPHFFCQRSVYILKSFYYTGWERTLAPPSTASATNISENLHI